MESTGTAKYILEKIKNNKNGNSEGIFSICSANQYVLAAGIARAQKVDGALLIEATSNQVNQFGGYTGMTPSKFASYVRAIAEKTDFPQEKIILGGDHLGPYPWRNKPAETAITNSSEMVRAYVAAGFKKIHIDASMYCLDDDRTKRLSKQLSADRAVQICKHAEAVASEKPGSKPLYVIGTEVPLPGGQQESENQISVTSVEDVEETLYVFKQAFMREGLTSAWDRVIAVVIQPGVEFGEDNIVDYRREKTKDLKKYIKKIPGVIFEAHSTDYQTKENLRKMVEDHFAILKVGPALTYNFREAVFGLQSIEKELFSNDKEIVLSNIIPVIYQAMDANPDNWKDYYQHNKDLEIVKLFGFSDRIRYYWNTPEVEKSLDRLLRNLKSRTIPLSLISQYFPYQYVRIRNNELSNDPIQLIVDHIGEVIDCYSYACISQYK